MDGERSRPEGVRERERESQRPIMKKDFAKGHRTQRSILTRTYRRVSRN